MIPPTPSDQLEGREQAILFAPFGVGKTTMAMTISAQCPAHVTATIAAPPPTAPVATIDDIAWLAVDRNALAGFKALKVRVPLLYDLSAVPPTRIVEEVLEILAECRKTGVQHVVVDTLTAFDTVLQARHRAKAATNKMAYYDSILADHMRVWDALRQTDATVQLLAHVKPAFDADDAAKLKRQTLEIADFAAQITGQAGTRYKADCDFIFFLQRKTAMLNGKKQTRVVVRTQPQGGTECKVRGGVGVPEELDADWRVIRAALAMAPEVSF